MFADDETPKCNLKLSGAAFSATCWVPRTIWESKEIEDLQARTHIAQHIDNELFRMCLLASLFFRFFGIIKKSIRVGWEIGVWGVEIFGVSCQTHSYTLRRTQRASRWESGYSTVIMLRTLVRGVNSDIRTILFLVARAATFASIILLPFLGCLKLLLLARYHIAKWFISFFVISKALRNWKILRCGDCCECKNRKSPTPLDSELTFIGASTSKILRLLLALNFPRVNCAMFKRLQLMNRSFKLTVYNYTILTLRAWQLPREPEKYFWTEFRRMFYWHEKFLGCVVKYFRDSKRFYDFFPLRCLLRRSIDSLGGKVKTFYDSRRQSFVWCPLRGSLNLQQFCAVNYRAKWNGSLSLWRSVCVEWKWKINVG